MVDDSVIVAVAFVVAAAVIVDLVVVVVVVAAAAAVIVAIVGMDGVVSDRVARLLWVAYRSCLVRIDCRVTKGVEPLDAIVAEDDAHADDDNEDDEDDRVGRGSARAGGVGVV